MNTVSLPDEVRAACAWVAERARWVRIDDAKVEQYAAGLRRVMESESAEERPAELEPEAAAAFAICMNAINFGSGWWPTIRKRPGLSGYAFELLSSAASLPAAAIDSTLWNRGRGLRYKALPRPRSRNGAY